jgi:hypothetical protein
MCKALVLLALVRLALVRLALVRLALLRLLERPLRGGQQRSRRLLALQLVVVLVVVLVLELHLTRVRLAVDISHLSAYNGRILRPSLCQKRLALVLALVVVLLVTGHQPRVRNQRRHRGLSRHPRAAHVAEDGSDHALRLKLARRIGLARVCLGTGGELGPACLEPRVQLLGRVPGQLGGVQALRLVELIRAVVVIVSPASPAASASASAPAPTARQAGVICA